MEKCSSCERKLHTKELGEKWRKCRYCDAPVCFNCTRYLGVSSMGQYKNIYYLDVVCVCEKCKP